MEKWWQSTLTSSWVLVGREEGVERSWGAGSPLSIPVPTDLPKGVRLSYPNWLPLAGVFAQVPSRTWRYMAGSHGIQVSGYRPHLGLERPPALSPKGELMEAWLDCGPWTPLGGQGNLLRRPHCRDTSLLPGPLLSYCTALSPESKAR